MVKIAICKQMLSDYLSCLMKEFKIGNASELTYRSCLKTFVEATANGIHLAEEQRKTNHIGRPDFTSYVKPVKNGYVETKDLSADLDSELRSKQLTKYINGAIPNILLTNYTRFILVRNVNGEPKAALDVALTTEKKSKEKELGTIVTLDSELIKRLEQLLQEFYDYSISTITTAQELALELAKRTGLLRDLLKEQLEEDFEIVQKNETPTDSVYEFYLGFSELVKDKDIEKCVDGFAETITYGLFLARIGTKSKISRENAASFIPSNIRIIKKIFINVAGDELPRNVSWIVDEIIDILNASDIEKIISSFNFRGKNFRDPFTHFYEDFLQVYNPKKRKQLGVYYTPEQVVSFICRSINSLLKEKFKESAGLTSGNVTLLDPCAGTGTFLAQAFVIGLDELKKVSAGAESSFIKNHLLKDFMGFEISVAPYVISHLKLALLLERQKYELGGDERLQIYLTNALDTAEATGLGAFMGVLSAEVLRANQIKLKEKIIAVMGNPPYYKHSSNKSSWILSLTDSYKKDLLERRQGNLDDDYVKFVRFAQWKIEQNKKGILGFITNNSFIDSVTFRMMRKSLLSSFNSLYIVNLHGDSNLLESNPAGGKDENVFDIMQGVSISLFIKEQGSSAHRVFYFDKYGERFDKFSWLDNNDINSVPWTELRPKEPYYLFKPISVSGQAGYRNFYPINDIFADHNSGIETKKDRFVVAFTEEELLERMKSFTDNHLSTNEVKETLKIEDIVIGVNKDGTPKYEWNVAQARTKMSTDGVKKELSSKYFYRPFDDRWIYFSKDLVSRTRKPEADMMLSNNVSICVSRQTRAPDFTSVLIADGLIDYKYCEYSRGCYFFPLYSGLDKPKAKLLKPSHHWEGRQPNFTDSFSEFVVKEFRDSVPSAESIFYYIYAILHSQYYRMKYNDLLKIDFPRIPFVTERRKFDGISKLGERLAMLHLGRESPRAQGPKYFGEGSNDIVEYVKRKEEKVWINGDKYFDEISNEVWEFDIGNYPVLEKWLKSRIGRELSYREIQRFLLIGAIIAETIDVMSLIEKATSGLF